MCGRLPCSDVGGCRYLICHDVALPVQEEPRTSYASRALPHGARSPTRPSLRLVARDAWRPGARVTRGWARTKRPGGRVTRTGAGADRRRAAALPVVRRRATSRNNMSKDSDVGNFRCAVRARIARNLTSSKTVSVSSLIARFLALLMWGPAASNPGRSFIVARRRRSGDVPSRSSCEVNGSASTASSSFRRRPWLPASLSTASSANLMTASNPPSKPRGNRSLNSSCSRSASGSRAALIARVDCRISWTL